MLNSDTTSRSRVRFSSTIVSPCFQSQDPSPHSGPAKGVRPVPYRWMAVWRRFCMSVLGCKYGWYCPDWICVQTVLRSALGGMVGPSVRMMAARMYLSWSISHSRFTMT